MKLIAAVLLVVSAVIAQTAPPTPPATPQADYTIGSGYGVSPSSSIAGFRGNQEAWVQGAVRAANKLYITTTIDFTKSANVMRAGASYQVAPGLAFRVDGGLALGTVAIGSFSGGAIFSHVVSAKSNLSFTTEVRVTTNPAGPTGAVNVGIYVGLSKGFFKN